MQRSTRSATKRAAEASAAGAEPTAQRPRLDEEKTSAAAYGVPPQRTLLSLAQRCASDTLAAALSLLPFRHLPAAVRVCRAWTAATAKVQSKGITLHRVSQLTCACTSGFALRRLVTKLSLSDRSEYCQSDLQLAAMRPLAAALPLLRYIKITPSAEDIQTLLAQKSREQALADLRESFPSQLRELHLYLTDDQRTAVRQLLIDALPAMTRLQTLVWCDGKYCEYRDYESLSFDALLQLSQLTHLECICSLSLQQLAVIKQLPALRKLLGNKGHWIAKNPRALCHPPHRLRRLEWLNLDHALTNLDGEAMAELVRLSGLTQLLPVNFIPDAFPYLTRFPRLEELRVALWHHVHVAYEPEDFGMDLDLGSDESEEEWDRRFDAACDEKIAEVHEPLIAALAGCPALTELTVQSGQCAGEFGSWLMRAVPRLRVLHLIEFDVESLSFLRHAPRLVELDLIRCDSVRPSNLTELGKWTPQLERRSLRGRVRASAAPPFGHRSDLLILGDCSPTAAATD